jgi:hypothetical protein
MIEWFLPFLILVSPWLMLSSASVIHTVATQTDPLFPVLLIVQAATVFGHHYLDLAGVAVTLLSLVLANWFMLFRLTLFKELANSSRRQRAFRAR